MNGLPSRAGDEAVLNTYLGQRVRMARIALGISQQALADRLGLTFQQIQKYERGRNRISASRLFEIARVLGIGIEVFYEGLEEGAHGPLPSRMNDLTEAYERLSPQFGARELVELNQAFIRVPGPETRAKIIQLAELLAESGAKNEEAPARDADAVGTSAQTGERPRLSAKLAVA
ncbi:MAG: helix-turn-helix domain-containing protein [Alphaproteobacteria bacterium]